MPQRVYPVLTDNIPGLLPVWGIVVCKEKLYGFCLTVYFLGWLSARCLLFPLIREKVSGKIRRSQEDTCKDKVSMVTFSGIQLFCQIIDFQHLVKS